MAFQRVSPNSLLWQKKVVSRRKQIAILVLTLFILALLEGCGASGSSPLASTASQIQIAISPASATLNPSGQQQFTATVRGTSNSGVNWMATAGSISSSGVYTAPPAGAGSSIRVTATSVGNPTQRASSVVTVQPAAKLEITTSSLTGALANTLYETGLSASGGISPYRWSLSGGSLPSGITLQSASGIIAGTTSATGIYSLTMKVTDAASNSATQNLTLSVAAVSGSNFDGPAELPRVYLNTSLANTPAPGPVVTVAAGGDLQSAINSASCGETIDLQAGATFSGQYIFPAKNCDDQHWIIVRTSAADASLPPEGTRMTPCYAGVSSLPGRPAFPCASPQRILATISYAGTGDGPILFANGANHYRFLGLEITRAANNGKEVTALMVRQTEMTGAMSQIFLDRLYVHGTPTDDTRRGVDFAGGTSMAVVDSYISEFHCRAGACGDSQAVSGGDGDEPMGPYKVDDNFLEAATENIIFGGGAATQTPADIEIRFNHFFKPMFWMQGQPGFTAPAFTVKNHFELKNAQRVLFDSNILEDTWGGFTQHGFAVVLTPKNQGADDGPVCPLCQVTDVTIRYSTISHVGGGFVIGNSYDGTGGTGAPLAGERYSIHDVIVDDIDSTKYQGHGSFAQIGTIAQPLLQDVEINHVTAFPDHVAFSVGGPDTVQMPGFIISNSILAAGDGSMSSTGEGGKSGCAYHQIPITIVTTCFTGYVFSPNAILGSSLPSSKWPAGNLFYTTGSIGFVNYNGGNGGDYHLLPSSPAIGAASDGTNLGANVDEVLSDVSGVQ